MVDAWFKVLKLLFTDSSLYQTSLFRGELKNENTKPINIKNRFYSSTKETFFIYFYFYSEGSRNTMWSRVSWKDDFLEKVMEFLWKLNYCKVNFYKLKGMVDAE